MAALAPQLADSAPSSYDASDPAPLSRHYYSDLRSQSTPTARYLSHRSNYALHLPQTRPYQVSRPHAVDAAVEAQIQHYTDVYTSTLNWSYPDGKKYKNAQKNLDRLLNEPLSKGDVKRAMFKVCQREAPMKGWSPARNRDEDRKGNHAKRSLRREVKNNYIDALDAELGDPKFAVLGDGGECDGSANTVDGLSEAYYGDLIDNAVEKFTKKTGKMVARDWKELGVKEGAEGFWNEIGEEEWERIIMEEEMLFSSEGEQVEKLGSDWDWALVRDDESA